jgi:anti-sigma factor RsiW
MTARNKRCSMNCEQYQENISQLIDGELDSVAESNLFQHMSTCEACRVFFKNLLKLNHELTSARSIQVPASLNQRILTMNLSRATPMRRMPWLLSGRTYSFRAIGLAVLLSIVTTVFVSSFWYQHSQTQQTIVCLTPLPEVEVNGYVVVASSHTKGINQ